MSPPHTNRGDLSGSKQCQSESESHIFFMIAIPLLIQVIALSYETVKLSLIRAVLFMKAKKTWQEC